MKVEILIYAYLAVCASMIIFNLVCIFYFRHRDKKTRKGSINFTEIIEKQLELEKIDPKHKKFLIRKLKKVKNMLAFEDALKSLQEEKPLEIKKYKKELYSVFVYLTFEYGEKNEIKAAYFMHIIYEYGLFEGQSIDLVVDNIIEMIGYESIYCKENALESLYSIGNSEAVIRGLKKLDESNGYYHNKMITDGLLRFKGNRKEFDLMLLKELPMFSDKLRLAILDYLRFHTGEYCKEIFEILKNEEENPEIRFSCIRYFARYRYEAAREYLYGLTELKTDLWEYAAITASALGTYPGTDTEEILKKLLTSQNWYIRFNAAESLEKLGKDYDELIDIFEGKDRYASEMLRYRFDRKKLKEEVAVNE